MDSPLRGLPDGDEHTDAIRSASRRALVKLVDETIAAQAAFLIVAGDIWDGDWQDLRTGNFFIGQMRRLHENDVDVFIVLGNHDLHGAWQEQLRHTVPDNVVIFASAAATSVKREYRGLKVAIHGQSYERANQENNLAIGYPRRDAGVDFNVGILHTSLAGHSGGHDRYAPCALDDLRSRGYDYWALGHVHQRKTITEPGEPPIAYAGVLQGRQFRESGAKGAYLVGCNFASGRPDVSLAPLDVADVVWSEVEVDLAGLERKEEMSAAVEQRLRSLANDNRSILCNVVRIALRN
ncbi:MAG: DNA repair exonuclease, partial [Betaproteobacteria bacterium]|nr:DNA repair exonuclease [Betaproteobacteria bacterium]